MKNKKLLIVMFSFIFINQLVNVNLMASSKVGNWEITAPDVYNLTKEQATAINDAGVCNTIDKEVKDNNIQMVRVGGMSPDPSTGLWDETDIKPVEDLTFQDASGVIPCADWKLSTVVGTSTDYAASESSTGIALIVTVNIVDGVATFPGSYTGLRTTMTTDTIKVVPGTVYSKDTMVEDYGLTFQEMKPDGTGWEDVAPEDLTIKIETEYTPTTTKPGTYRTVIETSSGSGTSYGNSYNVVNVEVVNPLTFDYPKTLAVANLRDGALTSDQLTSLFEITATGDDGADVPLSAVTDDIDWTTPGIYKVHFTGTDSKGQVGQSQDLTLVLYDGDNMPPTVSTTTDYVEINNSAGTLTSDELITKFGTTATATATATVEGIDVDGTINWGTPGVNMFRFSAVDSEGRTGYSKMVVLNIIDDSADFKPTINTSNYEEVNLSDGELTSDELITKFGVTAADSTGAPITDIKFDGTIDWTKPGVNTITFTATDTTGVSVTTNPVTLNILDDPSVTTTVDTYEIATGTELTKEGLIADYGATAPAAHEVNVIFDNIDTNVPGTYTVEFYTMGQNISDMKSVELVVTGDSVVTEPSATIDVTGSDSVTVGDEAEYEVTTTVKSDIDSGVEVEVALPAGYEYVTDSMTVKLNGTDYAMKRNVKAEGSTINAKVTDDLKAGDIITMTFTANVKEDAVEKSDITATVNDKDGVKIDETTFTQTVKAEVTPVDPGSEVDSETDSEVDSETDSEVDSEVVSESSSEAKSMIQMVDNNGNIAKTGSNTEIFTLIATAIMSVLVIVKARVKL